MAPLPFDSLPVEPDNSSAPEDLPFAPLPEGLPSQQNILCFEISYY